LLAINHKSEIGFSLSESGSLMSGAGRFWYTALAFMTVTFRPYKGLVPQLLRRTITMI